MSFLRFFVRAFDRSLLFLPPRSRSQRLLTLRSRPDPRRRLLRHSRLSIPNYNIGNSFMQKSKFMLRKCGFDARRMK